MIALGRDAKTPYDTPSFRFFRLICIKASIRLCHDAIPTHRSFSDASAVIRFTIATPTHVHQRYLEFPPGARTLAHGIFA